MNTLIGILSKRLFIYMILILVGLCTISVLLYKMSKAGEETLFSIQQERTIINHAANLVSLADEMAMSGRGYYITKEKEFLEAFQRTRSALIAQNDQLIDYANRGILPISTINAINLLLNKRIAVSDSLILMTSQNKQVYEKSKRYIIEATGYSNKIRKSVQEFITRRLQLISGMEQKNRAAARTLQMLFAFNILSLILVVVIGFSYLYKSLLAKAKAEKALLSYRQSSHFINSLSEGLVVQNSNGFILESNTAAEQILGLSANQLQGKTSLDPLWRSVHEDGSDFPGKEHPAMQVLATAKSQENIVMGVHKPSGELTWININAHPVYADDTGTVLSVVSTFSDITIQRNAQQKLKQNEARLRLALDKTGDNAWEHNFKTGITWFSSANNRFLGFNKNESIEDENKGHWWESAHPEDKGLLQKNDEEYKAGLRESHSLEYRIYDKNGSMKWVLDRGVVIEKKEDGTPLRIVGTHTDITIEKELQKKMVEQEQQKKQAIVEAVIQAQEKEREEISYELHEEVSQILSSVKIFLGIAALNPPDSQNYLQMATERTTEAIEELRKISQNINSSTLKTIGLTDALKDMIGQAKQDSTVQFKIDVTNYDAAIDIDFPLQLTIFRIVQAQIKNITRHSEAETASVTLSNSEQIVKLSIVDNGKGFNKKSAHYGLGLKNIIHRAEQYHGSVEINTEPGKGCRLHVTLPFSVV